MQHTHTLENGLERSRTHSTREMIDVCGDFLVSNTYAGRFSILVGFAIQRFHSRYTLRSTKCVHFSIFPVQVESLRCESSVPIIV